MVLRPAAQPLVESARAELTSGRPVLVPVRPDVTRLPTIPAIAELGRLAHWLVWEAVPKPDGGLNKVPRRAVGGGKADVTRRATQTTLPTAIAAYQTGNYGGVGFAFHKEARLTGVDLDKCRDPETGEIAAWAWAEITAAGTYAEVSPSGTGVKLFGRGSVPRAYKTASIEVYDDARFFTVTGHHVPGTPDVLNDVSGYLATLCPRLETLQGRNGVAGEPVAVELGDVPADIAAKLKTLLAKPEGVAARTWRHDRPDLQDQSLSSYDMSLCAIAARQGWSDDELAALIAAHRAAHGDGSGKGHRRDYLARTISRARAAVAGRTEEPATRLPLCWGEEGTDRKAGLAEQRACILAWVENAALTARARWERDRRREAEFAAAGLNPADPETWEDEAEIPFDFDLTAPLPPVVEVTLEEITALKRGITRRVTREVLAAHGLERLPRHGWRLLVGGSQGTGKSRTVAEGIAAVRGGQLVIWWLVPTLERAKEQAAEYRKLAGPESPPVTVVRGRGAPDPAAVGADPAGYDEKNPDPRYLMCPRFKVAERAGAMGVDVQTTICATCPLKEACGFQRQRRELPETGLYIMAHEYLWVPGPAPAPGMVVVDEDVTAKAVARAEFDPARLVDPRLWSPEDPEQAGRLRRLAEAILEALTKHRGRELARLRELGVTDKELKEAVAHLAGAEETRPDVAGWMSDKDIHARLDKVDQGDGRRVATLLRQVRRELPRRRVRLTGAWHRDDVLKTVDGVKERVARLFATHLRKPLLKASAPVLLLDGTGSGYLSRKVWGDRLEHRRFAIPRQGEVVQVRGRNFSRQSLTGRDRRGEPLSEQKLTEAARLRAEFRAFLATLVGRALVVSYKAVAELLRLEGLPPGVEVAHFGGIRGLNLWEDYDNVVILGRQQPSAVAVEDLARAFLADEDAALTTALEVPGSPDGGYVRQTRRLRTRDGSVHTMEVLVDPDARVQEVLEQLREAEAVQAVDRVRPIWTPRQMYLLTPVVLDVTVDRVLRWTDLQRGGTAVERALASAGDALPLAPAWLVGAGLCPSLRTAKRLSADIQAHAFRKGQFPNNNTIGELALSTRYRVEGQDRPSHALLRVGAKAPRAALEAALAPARLVWCELPPDEPPPAARKADPRPADTAPRRPEKRPAPRRAAPSPSLQPALPLSPPPPPADPESPALSEQAARLLSAALEAQQTYWDAHPTPDPAALLAGPAPPPVVLRPAPAELPFFLPGFPAVPPSGPIPPGARCGRCGAPADPFHPLLRFLSGTLEHDLCPAPRHRRHP